MAGSAVAAAPCTSARPIGTVCCVHRYDRGDEEQAENGAHSIDIAHGGSDLEEPAVATRVPYSLATRVFSRFRRSMSRNFTLH